jgi:S-DNA-T family DNA segregation ATPase FtsK/SpoIIIE
MNILGPSRFNRLNEAIALVFLFGGLLLTLCLVSYFPQDPSWDSVSGAAKPHNLIGVAGAYAADFAIQFFGLAAYGLPVLVWAFAWAWGRSQPVGAGFAKTLGTVLLVCSVCTGVALGPEVHPWGGSSSAAGVLGILLADYGIARLNMAGTFLLTVLTFLLSLYLISRFSMAHAVSWWAAPAGWFTSLGEAWTRWRVERRRLAEERAQIRAEKRALKEAEKEAARQAKRVGKTLNVPDPPRTPEIDEPLRNGTRFKSGKPVAETKGPIPDLKPAPVPEAKHVPVRDTPPWEDEAAHEIPIQELEHEPPPPAPVYIQSTPRPEPPPVERAPAAAPVELPQYREYTLPSTQLLNEPAAKSPYDSAELKEIATRIKSKLEEFNVLGNVVQINPGPVVTTFEFKPEAGIKYSRITTLNEDLCMGLQAESILIERIPGKPTVGVEVPNSRREVISLRQILESEEFLNSASKMTICLGKDINGRIKVAALESMPHLLIAGSTGSGKSVMLNSLIMSILYKATPDEVRMILVDPKRLEMGLYEGIPHLLTPVITDAKKATNALRNAVLEMERRLKLLASQGVRNIDQFNRKVRQLREQPLSLFEEDTESSEIPEPLPFILIIIDELADLMMLERANVEESVTRLAQMARAVGMHLVLATQRPSVDVITGLIKANFPSRISFRVATRVDSRTVLDVMGADHLLGKGDMLFLPPGSSRLMRVHGAFVTEVETNRVVEYWKKQARPDYDQTFLLAPPDADAEGEGEEFDGTEDPMYQDAVKVVMEMGKASTSTLQRRLRLGYGRAARILDMMQRDGIIGPPDGSKPREVLKRPDWLREVETAQ